MIKHPLIWKYVFDMPVSEKEPVIKPYYNLKRGGAERAKEVSRRMPKRGMGGKGARWAW